MGASLVAVVIFAPPSSSAFHIDTSSSAKFPLRRRFSPSAAGPESSSSPDAAAASGSYVNVTLPITASVVPVLRDMIEKYLIPFVSGTIVAFP